jgi:hypothetical protein
VWLNPEMTGPVDQDGGGMHFGYQSTVDVVRGIFPMFPLTLSGLDDAIKELLGRRTRPMVLPKSIHIL